LQKKLRFEKQTALYVNASYSGVSVDDTAFGLAILPAEGVSLKDAENALDTAVAEFMADGIDAEQLARIKMQYRASQIYAQDDTDGLANAYGRALASDLTLQDIYDWPDILQSITADEILDAAKAVFNLNASVTGWVSNQKGDGL
jgi:zinc protease